MDVRGERNFAFLCTFQLVKSRMETYGCSACRTFVNLMTSNLVSLNLMPLLREVCLEQLKNVVTNPRGFCVAGANFAYQVFAQVKETYFKDYQLCTAFDHCEVEYETPDTKCKTCKFLLEQFKGTILLTNHREQYYKNNQLDLLLQTLCYHLDIDCKTSSTQIMKKMISLMLNENNIDKICQIFKQC